MSSKEKPAVQNYLETWVGTTNVPRKRTANGIGERKSRQTVSPLHLSGSSYLVPTLRLDRRDTAELIEIKLSRALEEKNDIGAVKSMLQGKVTTKSGRWRVPIVLDLGALVADGSPHYVPPEPGMLQSVVAVLDRFGISVLGVSNAPKEMEPEAIRQLGLTYFLSKGRVIDNSKTVKFRIEDVIQMVVNKARQEDETEADKSEKPASDRTGEPVGNIVVSSVNESSDVSSNDTVEEPLAEMVPNECHVYYGSVRSGQQVAAEKGQSLVVIGSVNSGGEVLSDGDIFVFGKLRGRALAGLASEQRTSRIVSTSFDPELVCIGDTFTTIDSVEEVGLKRPGEAAMASLSANGEIVVEELPI